MILYDFAKHGLLPGSLGFFFVFLVLGFAALRFRTIAGLGTYTLAILTIGYLAMSMPMGAWFLGRLVSIGYPPIIDASEIEDIDTIVVLDGGTLRFGLDGIEIVAINRPTAIRALEVVRLYRKVRPSLVVVSGGAYRPTGKMPEAHALRDVLVAAGVPANRVVVDSMSRDTKEHALNVSAILRARAVSQFVLVTSSVHMRRAIQAFAAMNLRVVPAPAPLEAPGRFPWWPNTVALDRSLEAWHEIVGLLRDLMISN